MTEVLQHYKDANNALYAISPGFEGLLPEGVVAISGEEAALLVQEHNANTLAVAPEFVEMRQARAELLIRGKFAMVDGYIAAMTGIEGDLARNEWEFAQTVRKDSALANSVAAMLEWDDAAKDDFLIKASAR